MIENPFFDPSSAEEADPLCLSMDRAAGALRRVHSDLAYLNVAETGATTTETLATQA